jgi:hypothetical protein
VSALEGDQNPTMNFLITALMIITALVMILMLAMVLVEKCCGIKPSHAAHKCKRMCKGKQRVVDHSQVESDDSIHNDSGSSSKFNQVMPIDAVEEVHRDGEESNNGEVDV